jgi:hypothetical protein
MHLLENFFELVKIVLHDCNRFPDVWHAVAKTRVVDDAFQERSCSRNICGRENFAGVWQECFPKRVPYVWWHKPYYSDIRTKSVNLPSEFGISGKNVQRNIRFSLPWQCREHSMTFLSSKGVNELISEARRLKQLQMFFLKIYASSIANLWKCL